MRSDISAASATWLSLVAFCGTAIPSVGEELPPPNGLAEAGKSTETGKAVDRAAASCGHKLVIRPAPKGRWDASLRDVEKILYSTARELWVYFPERELPPILVDPKGGPIILFRRGPNGEYLVRLATGSTYWSQYTFQFAHEFCHILCNYTERANRNKWFEESICEMASLFVLRSAAETWKTDPPYPNWRSYGSALRKYADDRIADARLPENATLAAWYRSNAEELYENACLRDKNRIVAGELLPLFEDAPEHWEAVTYLNASKPPPSQTFEDYLQSWHENSPEKHRKFIRQIGERFGVVIEEDAAEEDAAEEDRAAPAGSTKQ